MNVQERAPVTCIEHLLAAAHPARVSATPLQQALTVSSVKATCRSNRPSRVSVTIFTVSMAELQHTTSSQPIPCPTEYFHATILKHNMS